jgi:hypothetical protein
MLSTGAGSMRSDFEMRKSFAPETFGSAFMVQRRLGINPCPVNHEIERALASDAERMVFLVRFSGWAGL